MEIIDVESLLFDNFPFEPTQEKRIIILALAEFILNGNSDNVFLLKGYAGTGKTTLIDTLVKSASKLNKRIVFLAPNNRAAKVMLDYSGQKAFTIHTKIYQIKRYGDSYLYFSKNVNYNKALSTDKN